MLILTAKVLEEKMELTKVLSTTEHAEKSRPSMIIKMDFRKKYRLSTTKSI